MPGVPTTDAVNPVRLEERITLVRSHTGSWARAGLEAEEPAQMIKGLLKKHEDLGHLQNLCEKPVPQCTPVIPALQRQRQEDP